jgi:hypothetical protein
MSTICEHISEEVKLPLSILSKLPTYLHNFEGDRSKSTAKIAERWKVEDLHRLKGYCSAGCQREICDFDAGNRVEAQLAFKSRSRFRDGGK